MAVSSDSGSAGQQQSISDTPSSAAPSLSSAAASRPSSPPLSFSSPSECSGSNPGLSTSSSVFPSAGLWSSVCPSSLKSPSMVAGTSAAPPSPPPPAPSSSPPPAGSITAVAASPSNLLLWRSFWQRRSSLPEEAELSLSLGVECSRPRRSTSPIMTSRSEGCGRNPSSRSKVAEQMWLRWEEVSPFRGRDQSFGAGHR